METPGRPALALIPSPFLGAESWRPVEAALLALGWRARAVDLAGADDDEGGHYRGYANLAAAQLLGPSILVAHSGGGGLVPAIAQAAQGQVARAIYVDALLPHPGRSWFDTAPPFLVEAIRNSMQDGRAAPWTSLVPSPLLEGMLPDPAVRASLARSCPAVAIAYLEERAPNLPQRSFDGCSAYLQLSPGYDTEAAAARALDWPVEQIEGHHLSIMTAPADIARAIGDLINQLAASP